MKSPAFQFYPNDWLSSPHVMLMTPEQEGAYIRLLCLDWANDGIPDDDNILAVLSRLNEGWLKGASRVVKECFNQHPTKPQTLTNKRLQIEREKQAFWSKKSSEGGKRSAETRLNKSIAKGGSRVVQPKVNRPVQPKVNSMSSSSSSSSINTPVVPTGDVEEIYQAYPKKAGKPMAIKAITKALTLIPKDELLAIVKRYASARATEDPQYTPMPATWFNGQRWTDDPATWKSQAHNGKSTASSLPLV